MDLSTNELCLDFCNLWGTWKDPELDSRQAYERLVRWARCAGIVGAREASRMGSAATADPQAVGAVLRRARELREAIFESFASAAAGRALAEADLQVLNRELARAMPQLHLKGGDEPCCWEWSVPEGALDRILWPVVYAAAALLTSERVSRVRQCASESCSWLFLDTSRNGRRRWCDMASCGNRAKARRYYERHGKKRTSGDDEPRSCDRR